jgi:ribonuclease HI
MKNSASIAASDEVIAYIDGGSRGNPGPAGFGVVVQDSRGRTLETLSESIGVATNNVAEYRALLAALDYAVATRARRLKIFCDSELIVRQMQGRYRVQSPDLKPLHEQARQLLRGLEHFSIEHVPRARNLLADQLANEAMDRAGTPSARPAEMLLAVVEDGRFRPLASAPELEEGAVYELRLRKRPDGRGAR